MNGRKLLTVLLIAAMLFCGAFIVGYMLHSRISRAQAARSIGDTYTLSSVSASEVVWGADRIILLGVDPIGKMTYSRIALWDDLTVIEYNDRHLEFGAKKGIAMADDIDSAGALNADVDVILAKAAEVLSLAQDAPADTLLMIEKARKDVSSVEWQYRPAFHGHQRFQTIDVWNEREAGSGFRDLPPGTKTRYPVKIGATQIYLKRSDHGSLYVEVKGMGMLLEIQLADKVADIKLISGDKTLYIGTNNRNRYPKFTAELDKDNQRVLLKAQDLAQATLDAEKWPPFLWNSELKKALQALVDGRFYAQSDTLSYEVNCSLEAGVGKVFLRCGHTTYNSTERVGGLAIQLEPDGFIVADVYSMSLLEVNRTGAKLQQQKDEAAKGIKFDMQMIRSLADAVRSERLDIPPSLTPGMKMLDALIASGQLPKVELVDQLRLPIWTHPYTPSRTK